MGFGRNEGMCRGRGVSVGMVVGVGVVVSEVVRRGGMKGGRVEGRSGMTNTSSGLELIVSLISEVVGASVVVVDCGLKCGREGRSPGRPKGTNGRLDGASPFAGREEVRLGGRMGRRVSVRRGVV